MVHGPNLNLLGEREVSIYGRLTIKEIDRDLRAEAKKLKVKVAVIQSNHEGKIVDTIGKACKTYDGILINPAPRRDDEE